ncbi:MAG: hypothetical protein E7096_04635 [Bacteroides sp.]|nr:hypothetical protein [Bacteroides sp.]
MKKTRNIFILLTTLFTLLTTGCGGEPECPLNTISVARFNFLDSKTHASVTLTNSPMVTGIAIIDGETDIDTVFNQAQSYMSVPLSYTNQTTYVIHYTDIMRDTIEVTHKNIPYVNDVECSPMMFFEVEDVKYTTYALDSIKLVNPQITNEERINFNIYYRASDAE